MENILKSFVNTYPSMTNKELFDFIQDYGEAKFFVDLGKFWKDLNMEVQYANISYAYNVIKYYFEGH